MYYGLNLLRGIAAIGIVGCHLGLSNRTSGGAWVTSLCDFNVAIFATISGFLMTKQKLRVDYIKRRAMRLLPTYIVWSVVYIAATIVFDFVFDGGVLNERFFSSSYWVDVLFWGLAATHLWFLICLFYGQVLLCCTNMAFHKFFNNTHDEKIIIAGISLVLLTGSIAIQNWYCYYPVRLLSFLLLGYVLGGIKRELFWESLICTLPMLILHCLGRGFLPNFFMDYLLAIPVLILFSSPKFKECKSAALLSVTSMGVYLIHPLFARGISFVVSRNFAGPYNAFMIMTVWLSVWLCSFLAVIWLRRFDRIKRFIS